MKRLDAISMLLGYAEAVDGEFGGGPVPHCRNDAEAALRALGVTDMQIQAADRKSDLDRRRTYRQQRR